MWVPSRQHKECKQEGTTSFTSSNAEPQDSTVQRMGCKRETPADCRKVNTQGCCENASSLNLMIYLSSLMKREDLELAGLDPRYMHINPVDFLTYHIQEYGYHQNSLTPAKYIAGKLDPDLLSTMIYFRNDPRPFLVLFTKFVPFQKFTLKLAELFHKIFRHVSREENIIRISVLIFILSEYCKPENNPYGETVLIEGFQYNEIFTVINALEKEPFLMAVIDEDYPKENKFSVKYARNVLNDSYIGGKKASQMYWKRVVPPPIQPWDHFKTWENGPATNRFPVPDKHKLPPPVNEEIRRQVQSQIKTIQCKESIKVQQKETQYMYTLATTFRTTVAKNKRQKRKLKAAQGVLRRTIATLLREAAIISKEEEQEKNRLHDLTSGGALWSNNETMIENNVIIDPLNIKIKTMHIIRVSTEQGTRVTQRTTLYVYKRDIRRRQINMKLIVRESISFEPDCREWAGDEYEDDGNLADNSSSSIWSTSSDSSFGEKPQYANEEEEECKDELRAEEKLNVSPTEEKEYLSEEEEEVFGASNVKQEIRKNDWCWEPSEIIRKEASEGHESEGMEEEEKKCSEQEWGEVGEEWAVDDLEGEEWIGDELEDNVMVGEDLIGDEWEGDISVFIRSISVRKPKKINRKRESLKGAKKCARHSIILTKRQKKALHRFLKAFPKVKKRFT